MVFASLVFLFCFLPLNLIVYFAAPTASLKNWVLIAFSLLFYAWGEPVWIALLVFSATIDYFHGLAIEKYRGTGWDRAAMLSSLTVNLGILAAFKYSGFLAEQVNALFQTHLPQPHFTLPIGISFYTFQTISYTADVYRGRVRAQPSYAKFLMFVSLYHQLVAGPIVRYADIAKQIEHRTHSVRDASEGITRFCIGLAKKVCIANVAAELVARYMDAPLGTLTVAEAWFGLLMFTLQIYFDFSGYSDMALGLGRIFGFRYLENFNYPYVARSATDFWRRWHISLGSFFRDYVYIPLGGKRRRPYRNLFVVWFLTGLWHGPSWNFVFWGLYYGVLITVERFFLGRLLQRLPKFVGHLYLLFAVVVGWALFYFVDTERLLAYLRLMFGASGAPIWGPDIGLVISEHALWLGLATVLCTPIYPRLRRRLAATPATASWAQALTVPMSLGLLLLATSMLVGRTYNPFLYFRF